MQDQNNKGETNDFTVTLISIAKETIRKPFPETDTN